MTAFTEKVTGQSKQDILNATLFAQLAADKKFNREGDTKNWYNFYKYVLGKIGFVIESFTFQDHQVSGATFSMDKVVLDILAAIATGGQTEVITATLAALRGLAGSDNRIKLFDSQSSKDASGNFQIYPCDQSPTGDVSIAMGAFYYKATRHQGGILFFHWSSSSTKIYKGAQKAVFNAAVYSNVRDQIYVKLGVSARNLVASIDI